jgi:hypothetical protein
MFEETVGVFLSRSAQSPSFLVEVSKKNASHTDDYVVSKWEPHAKHAGTSIYFNKTRFSF